jgi:hypothetical protein
MNVTALAGIGKNLIRRMQEHAPEQFVMLLAFPYTERLMGGGE